MEASHREYELEIFSDQNFVRDIVKGILHTIFFHRYFSSIRPSVYTPTSSIANTYSSSSRSRDSLAVPLPAILEPQEISAAIDTYTAALVAQLASPSSTSPAGQGASRGEVVVQLFDRKRRKTGITGGLWGRLGGNTSADEEVCWESWHVRVVVAMPRSEADRIKVRRAMESSLQKAAMKIVAIVNRDKDHIPPITTSDQNPFPYRILVNPKHQQQGMDRIRAWT